MTTGTLNFFPTLSTPRRFRRRSVARCGIFDLLKVTSPGDRDVILKMIYTLESVEKRSGSLLDYHFSKLEIALSHLATATVVALINTVKGNNIATIVELARQGINKQTSLIKGNSALRVIYDLWRSADSLLLRMLAYDGEPENLRKAIWLSFRAAKVLHELWGKASATPAAPKYYSPEKHKYAKGLPFPIDPEMPLDTQPTFLIKNINEALKVASNL